MRKRGDGEGSLWKDGDTWRGRWIEWAGDIKRRPKTSFAVADFPTKREAREELNRIIREKTGRVGPMPAMPTFEDIWLRYFALKKRHWSQAQIGAVEPVIRRGILPQIGTRDIAGLTFEPVQAALNFMADKPLLIGKGDSAYTRIGYGESALKTARTYMRAVFEFALDEGLITRNPATRLEIPPTRKPCGRYLSKDEIAKLMSAATGRERLILRLFIMAGLRPAELFALKTDDIFPGHLRIDEAIKEREKQASGRRLGSTKTETSDAIVPLGAETEAQLQAWASTRPAGAILFATDRGTTWRLGNYLKRVLKPLAESIAITDLTFQCLRRTCATHYPGNMKERQDLMRHADPATTMRHYQKSIPEGQRAAVEEMERQLFGSIVVPNEAPSGKKWNN